MMNRGCSVVQCISILTRSDFTSLRFSEKRHDSINIDYVFLCTNSFYRKTVKMSNGISKKEEPLLKG